MDLDELKLCFDLGENDVVFGLTPESLRSFCNQSAEAARFLAAVLGSRLGNSIDDAQVHCEREGYLVAMTDKQHVAKLLRIAKNCLAGCTYSRDVAEKCYEAHRMRREGARIADRHARATRTDASAPAPQRLAKTTIETSRPFPPSPTRSGADSTLEGGRTDGGDAGPPGVFLLSDVFKGQLNISILLTGTGVVTIGTSARQRWTEDSPLTITRISGIESGTTTIQYIGQELHVTDIETYAAVIQIGAKDEWGRRVRLGANVQLVENALLKALRRGDAKSYYVGLREQIARLQNAKMIIRTTNLRLIQAIALAMPEDEDAKKACKTGTLRVVVSLLGDSTSSAPSCKAGTVTIAIPSRARVLFGKGLSTWFKEDEYYRLKKPSSRRLYLLYRRHVNAWGFTREELREYLGSGSSSGNGFQKTLKGAFTEMYEAGLIDFIPKYAPSKSRYGIRAYEVVFGEHFLTSKDELVRRPGVSP
jgi:hypothetical protein